MKKKAIGLWIGAALAVSCCAAAEPQCVTDLASGPYPWYRGMNAPVAVYTNNQTFFTFHGGQPAWLDPLVMKYDHTTGLIEGPVKVGDNLLAPDSDTHGAPAIQVDREGYIHVIYGGHGWWCRYMRHAVSTAPFDISSWTHLSNIESNATYPTLYNIPDNKMLYFYREGNRINNHRTNWSYCCSSDNGQTWSETNKLLLGGARRTDGVYFESTTYYDGWYGNMREINGELHYLVQYHPCICAELADSSAEDRRRLHIYYLRRDTNGVWRSPDGTSRTPPFSREDMDAYFRVVTSSPQTGSNEYESISYRDFQLNSVGEPMILYRSEHYEGAQRVASCKIAWGSPVGTFAITNAPYTWFMRPSKTDCNVVAFYGDWGIYLSSNRCESSIQVADPFSDLRTTSMIEVPAAPDDAFILSMQPLSSANCSTNALKLYLWGTNGYVAPLRSNACPQVPGTPHVNVIGFQSAVTCSNTLGCVYGTRTNIVFCEYDPQLDVWYDAECVHAGSSPGVATDANLIKAGGLAIAAGTGGVYHILWNEDTGDSSTSYSLVWAKGRPGSWEPAVRVLEFEGAQYNRFPRLLYDSDREQVVATWIATGSNRQYVAQWPLLGDASTVSNAIHDALEYSYAPWAPDIAWNPVERQPAIVMQAKNGGSNADAWFAERSVDGWPVNLAQVNNTELSHDRYPMLSYLSDGTACILYEAPDSLGYATENAAGWTNYAMSISGMPQDLVVDRARTNVLLALISATDRQAVSTNLGVTVLRINANNGDIIESFKLDAATPQTMGAHLSAVANERLVGMWLRKDDIGGWTLFYSRLMSCGAADNDMDQLPDEWEVQIAGMTNLHAGGHDLDADGMTDYAEYVAGTAPDNSESLFRLADSSSGSERSVAWETQFGRLYTLYSTTNLDDQTMWTHVDGVTSLQGTGALMVYTCKVAHAFSAYRIAVERE